MLSALFNWIQLLLLNFSSQPDFVNDQLQLFTQYDWILSPQQKWANTSYGGTPFDRAVPVYRVSQKKVPSDKDIHLTTLDHLDTLISFGPFWIILDHMDHYISNIHYYYGPKLSYK